MNKIFLLMILLFLVGCNAILKDGDAGLITPTTHPFFIEPLTEDGTESPVAETDGTPAPTNAPNNSEVLVTVTPSPLPTVESASLPANGAMAVEPIYGDSLSEAWQLYRIDEIDINLDYTNRSHGGESAISFLSPSRNGRMLFTFQEDSEITYQWDEVVGLSFWIRSNGEAIPSSAISIGVLGSDEVTYWRAGDSVSYTDSDLLIETNLRAWGIDRPIPSNSWLEITVDLKALMQSESFEWFTGFYLRSEAGPSQAILIDDINLVVFIEDE